MQSSIEVNEAQVDNLVHIEETLWHNNQYNNFTLYNKAILKAICISLFKNNEYSNFTLYKPILKHYLHFSVQEQSVQ